MKISRSLKKQEILRGFRAFEEVLAEAQRIISKYITAYYRFTDKPGSFPVRVGFLVSKKKLKKHF